MFCGTDRVNLWDLVLPQSFSQWLLVCMSNTPEIARLEAELEMRDQLVQQLSQELFRLVKGNAGFMPSPEVSEQHQAEVRALRDQLRGVEKQIDFYQEQIEARDSEVVQLRQTVQELTDRTPNVRAGGTGAAHGLSPEIR